MKTRVRGKATLPDRSPKTTAKSSEREFSVPPSQMPLLVGPFPPDEFPRRVFVFRSRPRRKEVCEEVRGEKPV